MVVCITSTCRARRVVRTAYQSTSVLLVMRLRPGEFSSLTSLKYSRSKLRLFGTFTQFTGASERLVTHQILLSVHLPPR